MLLTQRPTADKGGAGSDVLLSNPILRNVTLASRTKLHAIIGQERLGRSL